MYSERFLKVCKTPIKRIGGIRNVQARITSDDYQRGFLKAMEEQKTYYESLLASLSIQQKKLFAAISNEPTANLFSVDYMFNHNLGSYGGVQGAFKKLLNLDYIEKRSDGRCYVVDPVFALWHSARK